MTIIKNPQCNYVYGVIIQSQNSFNTQMSNINESAMPSTPGDIKTTQERLNQLAVEILREVCCYGSISKTLFENSLENIKIKVFKEKERTYFSNKLFTSIALLYLNDKHEMLIMLEKSLECG